MKRWMSWISVMALAFVSSIANCEADEQPNDMTGIGGRWFVGTGEKPIYYYREGDRYVDLFSYHTKDSNKDGIDNVRIRHDEQFLIIESQGYPNGQSNRGCSSRDCLARKNTGDRIGTQS